VKAIDQDEEDATSNERGHCGFPEAGQQGRGFPNAGKQARDVPSPHFRLAAPKSPAAPPQFH